MNNSYQHDKNAEINYLNELINKSGDRSNLQASEPIKILEARYDELKKRRSIIRKDTQQNPDGYFQLCVKIHFFLYQEILNNAGQFRKISDPNDGNVYFGGTNCRTMKPKFTGTQPDLIKSELVEACTILFDERYEPIEKALRFYAEFVAIHPFYDANGRIGRHIVDLFLETNNCYVNWESLNRKHGKFLRKLNYCHSVRTRYKQFISGNSPNSSYYSQQKKYWESVREKYIRYLLKFWDSFVESIDSLEAVDGEN